MGMIGSLLPVLKRLWLLGTIVTLLCTGAAYLRASSGYVPMYQATASFTVRVVNPLYASVSTYNSETAAQMARTFPHILTSDPLKKSVKEFLGVSYVPEVVAEVIPGTNVFTLRVTDADLRLAHELLEYRNVHKKVTIVTSELDPDRMRELDPALFGRMVENCKGNIFTIPYGDSRNYRLHKGA
jgi:capsular polysaccharide biosynthesis protein